MERRLDGELLTSLLRIMCIKDIPDLFYYGEWNFWDLYFKQYDNNNHNCYYDNHYYNNDCYHSNHYYNNDCYHNNHMTITIIMTRIRIDNNKDNKINLYFISVKV